MSPESDQTEHSWTQVVMTLSFCWQTKTWFAGASTSETPLFLAGEADVNYKPAC
jgi:hypothetical protein